MPKASASPLSTKLLQVRVWRGFTSPIWQRGAADHSEPRSCSTSRCGMLRLRAFCSASNFISFDLNEHAHPETRKARHCWRARKSYVSGRSVSVRVDLGGRGILKNKTKTKHI